MASSKDPRVGGWWALVMDEGPLVGVALHAGHGLRPELAALSALDEAARLREEDPFTERLAARVPLHLWARRSRFEVDLNRPRGEAVYRGPQDAWGLELWKEPLSQEALARSRRIHDAFYGQLAALFDDLARTHGAFCVLDVHSYNHRRGGPDAPPEDPEENPDVNLGTGSMDRGRWSHVVEPFLAELRAAEVGGRPLDVRENVKFRGRELAAWTHERYPEQGCVLALEFKKTFMDEWTGALDEERFEELGSALERTLPVLEGVLSSR